GNAIEMDGAARVEPFDGGPLQRLRDWRCIRNDGDADVGLDQLDQVAFAGNLVAAVDVEAVLAERGAEPLGMFAVVARQQLLGTQILEVDAVARREAVLAADHKPKVFGEERPGVEPFPGLVDFGGDAELGLAILEHLADLAAVAAEKLELQPVELPPDLIEEGDQQREIDR